MRILSRLVIPLALAGVVLALGACALAFDWHLGDVAGWLSDKFVHNIRALQY